MPEIDALRFWRNGGFMPCYGRIEAAPNALGRPASVNADQPVDPIMHISASALLAVAIAVGPAVLAGSAAAQQVAPAVPVQAEAAKRQDVPVTLRNIGNVQSYYSVLVRARVDGTLDKFFAAEGQDVKAGDKLAQIDPRPYAAALAQAQAKKAADEAMLANARLDLTRYSNLARSDFASRQQVDTQNAAVAQDLANIAGDEAAIASARLNLEFCTITAPFDGRVGLRVVDPGNLVHAADSTGIVTVNQIHPIAVTFTLPQDVLPQVQAAMARGAVSVQAFAGDDSTLLGDGRLLTFDNAIDATTGTIKLKAEFANQTDRLWPGQFVNVHVRVGTLRDAVTVPSVAVQRGPNGLFVYVVKPDATVAIQPVELRQDDGQIAAIGKGVDAGATIVTNGMSRLQQGSHVTITAASAS
jgi:multidrug efflux system membrane fusion protein